MGQYDLFFKVFGDAARDQLDPAEIDTLLEEIDPDGAEVLRLRFGFDRDGDPRTLDEVARVLGVEGDDVRSREATAIAQLRPIVERET